MNLNDPVDLLTRTILGEARGEGLDGMTAVAWVVRNRADNPRWWGHDVLSVCLCPWQFSCWNQGDPNRAIISTLSTADLEYRKAESIVVSVLNGTVQDPTGGADSYFASYIEAPKWSKDAVFTCKIGQQLFYRAVLGVGAIDQAISANLETAITVTSKTS